MSKKFFLVWNSNSQRITFKHPTLDHALAEATRLASASNDEFFVLECVKSVKREVPPVSVKDVEPLTDEEVKKMEERIAKESGGEIPF